MVSADSLGAELIAISDEEQPQTFARPERRAWEVRCDTLLSSKNNQPAVVRGKPQTTGPRISAIIVAALLGASLPIAIVALVHLFGIGAG
jgi:hypothetical protein